MLKYNEHSFLCFINTGSSFILHWKKKFFSFSPDLSASCHKLSHVMHVSEPWEFDLICESEDLTFFLQLSDWVLKFLPVFPAFPQGNSQRFSFPFIEISFFLPSIEIASSYEGLYRCLDEPYRYCLTKQEILSIFSQPQLQLYCFPSVCSTVSSQPPFSDVGATKNTVITSPNFTKYI